MDTFSISLSIGTFAINKRKRYLFCFMVGILHFIMPIIGVFCGMKITSLLNIKPNTLLGFILLFIAIELIVDFFNKEEKQFNLNIISLLLLSVTVSIDSFSTGMGIHAITSKVVLSAFIFSFCASIFTYAGLIIGKYSNEKLGDYANIIGFLILLFLSITHLFNLFE